MSVYNIEWYDQEKTIAIAALTGEAWTWMDAYNIMLEQQKLVQSVSYPVSTILDFSASPDIPSVGALPNLKKFMNMRSHNETMVIFVGTEAIFKKLVEIVSQVYGSTSSTRSFHFSTTREDALEKIQAYTKSAT